MLGCDESATTFWRRQFPRSVELAALPFDRPRPPVPSYLREQVELLTHASWSAGLDGLSARLDIAPLAIVLAAVKTVLFRYGGQDLSVVGAAADSGTISSDAALTGRVLLPIRTDWSETADISGEDLVLGLARRLAEANAHADCPLREIQSWAGARDAAFGARLFNVAVCLAGARGGASNDPPFEDTELSAFLAQCDVVITAAPEASGIRLRGDFDADLFEPATVQRMLGHVSMVVEGIVRSPSSPVAQLPILTAGEHHHLVVERSPRTGFLSETVLHKQFEAQVERTPDALALTCDDVSLTYGELNARANRIAHRLIELGVKPDTLVGLCLDRSNDLVIALLAILKAGGAYLPIDLAYPADRLAFMLEDAQAPVLLTERQLQDRLPETRAQIVYVDDVLGAPVRSDQVRNLPTATGPDNLAYVIYTSGTTGKPKGSLITHRNVTRLFSATWDWYRFDERDVWTLFHSCAFDFSVWEIWGALLYGGRIVVVPFLVSRSPESFYELLAREGVTVLNQTPSAFRQLIQAEETVGQKALALRYVIFGGEALEMRSLKPWFDRHGDRVPLLVNMYGITETTVHVTYRPLSRSDLESGSVIGVPIPDLQIYVLDANRHPMPLGVPGEMYVGGAGLARGYLNRQELTAERFVPDRITERPDARLYRTGDLARILPGGDIEYLGRIDQQVKIRGFRIELGEIESVLCEHPAVREAVVMAREDDPGVRRLVGYVVTSQTPDVTGLREHLKIKLPEYMIPAAFVFLEKLPLTNNGKVDRKALPVPEQQRPELARHYVAPRTDTERKIAALWSKALRVEQVGVDDNFFELGGDSILCFQVISLARDEGLKLTPKLLFTHQTVAELAAAAGVVADISESTEESLSGDIPLTPIQHWFFEQRLKDTQHYNQAFLFQVAEQLQRPALEGALVAVSRHHDALRLRYRDDGGHVRQFYGTPEETAPLEWFAMDQSSEADQRESIEQRAAAIQAGLNLEKGPVWRVAYFDLGPARPGRLLIVVHHLAVDGVSWRPLLEDLETAYRQLETGRRVQLPAKTTSFKGWAERLETFAETSTLKDEQAYWRAITEDPRVATAASTFSGVDSASNTEGSCDTVKIALSVDDTHALIQRVPSAYNTQINDVLLTALTQAWNQWNGSSVLFVNLEGHGRESLFEGVDLSRTVGWFTSVFPVLLELPASANRATPGEALKSIKEQLRRIPQRGIGYGILRYLFTNGDLKSAAAEPSLVFNYLGQFEQGLSASKLFRIAGESTGPWHGSSQTRRHALEVNCLIIGGRLELSWTYSRNLHDEAAIHSLADGFLGALKALIGHCLSPHAGGRTPSDFALARLDQGALDRLLTTHADVDDIYPLSPIQTLFHAANPGNLLSEFDQWRCTLRGNLDPSAFQRAWRETLGRHPILRSTFHAEGLSEPLQIVHRDVSMPWTVEDWRSGSADERERRWSAFLDEDRAKPLNLTQAPVMRFALLRVADDVWKFLWSVPALLLDGWSWPLVFRDASRLYQAFKDESAAHLDPVRPYRDYLEWLRQQSSDGAGEFWRTNLAGFQTPTTLPGEPPDATSGSARYVHHEVQLSTEATSALQAAARRLRVTLSTLVQGGWAMLLERQSGKADIVFGAAFAGRPTTLRGAESIVGPLVNNLPVRTTVDPESSTGEFLQGLHARLLELNAWQFMPLMEIQSRSEVPWRYRLFDSVVVVQNYLVDESARRFGAQVEIEDFVGPIHSNYPVMLLAEPGSTLRLTLIYDSQQIGSRTVQRWGTDLARLMERLPAFLDKQVSELQEPLSLPVTIAARPRRRIHAESQNYVPPQTEAEKTIAAVWRSMFDLERVGIEENFFELGGHSLLVVQMHRRLREALKKDFPVVTLFQHPTVRSLAHHLTAAEVPASETARQLRDRADRQKHALAELRTRLKRESK